MKQLDMAFDAALRAPVWVKPAGRARSPVRRFSKPRGAEALFYRPISAKQGFILLRAAERLELTHRLAGKKNGPLGHVALEVLRELLRLVDYRTGRLEPCYDTLARNLRRARSAIIEAMARLKSCGLVDWLRRFEPDPTQAGRRGPQIKQISNAYRFCIPAFVAALMGHHAIPAPLPLDDEARRDAWRRQRGAWEIEADPQSPLFFEALERLRFVVERKSDQRSEPRQGIYIPKD